MLLVALLLLLVQVLVQVFDFLGFYGESVVGGFSQFVYIIVELVLRFGQLVLEFVLEGQQSVVGALGLVGDELLAVLYLPALRHCHLSISWKRASSCFLYSSLFFFM